MSKLSLDALKERAGATASTELLSTISGGLENACHDSGTPTWVKVENQPTILTPVVEWIVNLFD
jgi:hypothetical protein